MSNCQLVIIQNVILTEFPVAHKHWEGVQHVQHVQRVYASALTIEKQMMMCQHIVYPEKKPSNQQSPLEVLCKNNPCKVPELRKSKGKR